MRERLKWWLYPGLNLHARLRYRLLPHELGSAGPGEARRVLDAGCGNGMLSYQAWRRGNHVLGVSLKPGEVERNQRLFHDFLGIPRDRLAFRVANLYEVASLEGPFDEVICSETLEHIRGDEAVVRGFWEVLRPGGTLHLCCPNADHPDNQRCPLDPEEKGGHVRPGYTLASYRALLEPVGFEIRGHRGLGGPARQALNRLITWTQDVGGLPLGLMAFALAVPTLPFGRGEPRVPYSLYVRARKPLD